MLSVQASEVLWVALNLLGVERVDGRSGRALRHSIATMVGAAALVWLVLRALGRPRLGLALGVGVLSHLVLDLLSHDHDLVLAPGLGVRLGLGLYGTVSVGAPGTKGLP